MTIYKVCGIAVVMAIAGCSSSSSNNEADAGYTFGGVYDLTETVVESTCGMQPAGNVVVDSMSVRITPNIDMNTGTGNNTQCIISSTSTNGSTICNVNRGNEIVITSSGFICKGLISGNHLAYSCDDNVVMNISLGLDSVSGSWSVNGSRCSVKVSFTGVKQ